MKLQRQSTQIIERLVAAFAFIFGVAAIRAAESTAPETERWVKDAEIVIVAVVAHPTPTAAGTHFVSTLYTLKGGDLPLFHMTGIVTLEPDKTYILFLRTRKPAAGAAEKGVTYVESVASAPLLATHENLAAVVQSLKGLKSPVMILRVENSKTERDLTVFRLYDDGSFEEFRRPDPEQPEALPKRDGKATAEQAAELAKAVVLSAGQISEPDAMIDPAGHAHVNWIDATGDVHDLSFGMPHRELLEFIEPFIRQHAKKPLGI